MKKRLLKRIVAIILCFGMSFGLFDDISFVRDNLSSVGEVKAADGGTLANIAEREYNAYRGTNGNGRYGNGSWCCWFVNYCARAAGIETNIIPSTGSCTTMYNGLLGQCGATVVSTPQRGDLCFYKLNRTGLFCHVGIMVNNSESIQGNIWVSGYGTWYKMKPKEYIAEGGASYTILYVRPRYQTTPNYTLSTGNATNISNNNARISGSMSPAGNVNAWGFYIGTSSNPTTECRVSYGTTYSGNMWCDVSQYYSLKYGTTYYYKTWAEVNGQRKVGDVKSFRTTATKPDIPSLKINSDNKDIGLESSANVYWAAVSNAGYYKLYLYDENNTLVETSGNVTGTKYAFSAAKKTGIYRAQIEAYNEVGTRGKSSSVYFTVHPDVTVTFMNADTFVDVSSDYEPEELGKQTVHYGKAATAPAKPEHTGYTFKNWSKAFSNVKEDTTVKAVYEINKYNVTYINSSTSLVLGTEKVNYYSSAHPVDYAVPTGYIKTGYDGWDKDYKQITEDTVLRSSIGWYNENFPIYAELLSAVREYDAEESDNEGYTVKAKVTNWDKSTTKGRVVVALKTKEGKLLTSTESAAFSVKKNANKEIEIFVPYNKAASVAEIYVVGQYTDAVPITTTASNNATKEIDQTNVLSNWSTEAPPVNALRKEERTEYRHKDKSTTNSFSTSLAGWTQSGSSWVNSGGGSVSYVPSFPSGFNTGSWIYNTYAKAPPTAYETATTKRTVSSGTTGYVYYHWCRGATLSAPTNRLVDGWQTSTRPCWHAFTTNAPLGWDSGGAFYGYLPNQCMDTYWWIGHGEGNPANIPIQTCNYTDYKKQFSYYKWSDFSDWSTAVCSASASRVVESRKVYRYLSEDMMQEDTSGVERVVKGSVGKEFAGKEATLFIYKVDEASDYTNEYVSQTTLDEEGNYNFTFKLREEPSVKTGDLTVTLGIEGNSTAIYLDTIKAPKKTHKVRFLDYDGKVISEQEVEEGRAAELPSAEETKRTGYTFTKWSDTNINITEDKDLYAEYALNKYNVVFVDWRANTVSVQEFEYGAKLTTPIAEEPDESEIVEWDLVAQGVETVTDNLIVCTQYRKKTFEVKIYGFDGKVLDEQTIEYGNSVVLPELNEEENKCIFYGWKNVAGGADEKLSSTVIKSDTTLVPDFSYIETVEAPTADVSTGEYKEEQTVTLKTATQGARIYYTIDGTDPSGSTAMLYNAPISISDATILKFYAVADKKNDSDVMTEYYVINYEGARSKWVPYAQLPDEVKENQEDYNIYSDTGYSYKESKEVILKNEGDELEQVGWARIENEDKWSEYSEWQDSPILNDGKYIEIEEDTQPVYSSTTKYEYSHYVYKENEVKYYSPTDVEGKDCQLETITLDKSMAIAGFTEDGVTYFIQDGVNWYNQRKTVGKTQTGTKYRFRKKIASYEKWTDYSVDIPEQNEEREYRQSEVFSYVRHNKYIVSLYGISSEVEKQIIEEGDNVNIDDLKNKEGYEFDALYQDAEYTRKWLPSSDKVTGNTVLYVKYIPKKYTVTFKDEDGNKIDSQSVEYLEEAEAPEPVAVKDKVFLKWDTNDYMCVYKDTTVTANYIPVDEYATVNLEQAALELKVGTEAVLNAQITPISESETTLFWESSDNSVAVVSDRGVVSCIGEGTAEITAKVGTTGEIAKCSVKVGLLENNSDSSSNGETIDVPGLDLGNNNQSMSDTESIAHQIVAKAKAPVSFKVKNNKKKMIQASWKKVSKAKGYQIQYATNKKFKKAKSKTAKKTSVTISKLTKKKTYYIRVRAYQMNGKKKVYGKWSKVKKIKIKK